MKNLKSIFGMLILVLAISLGSCSKGDGPEPQPEPPKPIEAKLTVQSFEYDRTVGETQVYKGKVLATINGTGTLTVDNDEGDTKTFTGVKSGVAFNFEISFKNMGNHEVDFEIKDSKGKEAYVVKTVTVDDKTPGVTASAVYSNTIGSIENNQAINEQQISLSITVNSKNGASTVKIENGDGEVVNPSYSFESGVEYSEVITYTNPGQKTITITATDNKGNVGEVTINLTVEDREPVVVKWGYEKGEVVIENDVATAYNYTFPLITKTFENKTYKATVKVNGEVKIEQEGLTSNEEINFDYSFATHGDYTVTVETLDSDGNLNVSSIDVEVEEYVSPTPNDPFGLFEQPMNYIDFGISKNDFYGSGDANQDGEINSTDENLIRSGTSNKYTDINRDGKTNSLDADCINEGMDNLWMTLAHNYWSDNVSVNQRREFCKRTATIAHSLYIQTQMFGWYCTIYSFQSIFYIQGSKDPSKIVSKINGDNSLNPEFSGDYNGYFNLSCYEASTKIDDANQTPHSVLLFPVSKDLRSEDGIMLVETATNTVVESGTYFVKAGYEMVVSYIQSFDNYISISRWIIKYQTGENGKLTFLDKIDEIKSLQNPR